MLQADTQLLPTSRAQQQQQQQQTVLQGVPYLAAMPAAVGVPDSSRSGSFGYHSSEAVDSGACLATGVAPVSDSNSLAGYSAAAAGGVVAALPGMAISVADQQGVQDLQYYQAQQQQQQQLQQQQSQHGPQGW
jgi:hypothetical protein